MWLSNNAGILWRVICMPSWTGVRSQAFLFVQPRENIWNIFTKEKEFLVQERVEFHQCEIHMNNSTVIATSLMWQTSIHVNVLYFLQNSVVHSGVSPSEGVCLDAS